MRQALSTLWSSNLFLCGAPGNRHAARPYGAENSFEAVKCAASGTRKTLRKSLCLRQLPGTAKPIFTRREKTVRLNHSVYDP